MPRFLRATKQSWGFIFPSGYPNRKEYIGGKQICVLSLVKGDGGLNGALVLHGLEALGPLLNLEDLVDNSVDFHLSGVEIVDGSREFIGLAEASKDGDFVTDYKRE